MAGRPRTKWEDLKTHHLSVPLTAETKIAFTRKAEDQGMKPAQLARKMIEEKVKDK